MKFGKLDIAAGIVIALAFFLGYFNLGLCAILVLIVLIVSDDRDLIKNVIAAFLFNMVLAFLGGVLFKVSMWYGGLQSFIVTWFFSKASYETVSKFNDIFEMLDLCGFVERVIDVFTVVMALVYSIKSLKGKNIKVMFVDKIACKIAGIAVEKKSKDDVTNEEETLTDIPKKEN